MTERNLRFDETKETRDEYLTRIAKVLYAQKKGEIILGEAESSVLRNDIGRAMMPDIKDAVIHCRALGRINDIEEDFKQNLAMMVYSKLHLFNNSQTKDHKEEYKFITFVNIYVDDIIRKTRGSERGYTSRSDRKKISKVIQYAARVLGKKESLVTVEEIHKYMPEFTKILCV